MKKLLLSLVTVCLFFSCDNGDMNDENDKNEQGYLTITYHSEGHTSGEVPVDDNEYPIMATGYTHETHAAAPYRADLVPVSGPGTLEREGYRFGGWKAVDSADPEKTIYIFKNDYSTGFLSGYGTYFEFEDKKSKHYEFHAIWEIKD